MAKETAAQRRAKKEAEAAAADPVVAFHVDANTAQAIHDYLTTRPMAEVEHLVQLLRGSRRILASEQAAADAG